MARHNVIYIVREELEGGYMPDTVSYFATKREAQGYARDRADSARDDGYTVTGNMRDGYTLTPTDASDYTLDNLIIIDSHPLALAIHDFDLPEDITVKRAIEYICTHDLP